MRDKDQLKRVIGELLDVRAGDEAYRHMLDAVLDAHASNKRVCSAATPSIAGRFTMRKPMTRFALAAAIVAAIVLGLFEFVGTEDTSGVAWGKVAQKVQTSRCVIYREMRGSERPATDGDRAITYLTPTQYRSDSFQKNQPWISMYDNRATGKRVVLLHAHKGYALEDLSLTEQSDRKHANYQNPAWWVQTFLTCKYTKLSPKEVEGVLCEGIETTDLALLADHENSVKNLVARLWVSVETGYPVLFDGEFHGAETSYTIFDQFQWDVEIDPAVFKPNIPADYEQM